VSASPEVVLEPRVLEWARNRVGLSETGLADKVGIRAGRVMEWERTGHITLSQAQRVARATYTPLGYLYLTQIPPEQLPVTDFRVVGDEPPERPSPNLLDVLDGAGLRQDWYGSASSWLGSSPERFRRCGRDRGSWGAEPDSSVVVDVHEAGRSEGQFAWGPGILTHLRQC
jgi:hypothetical protein